jgi:hypothetical protein
MKVRQATGGAQVAPDRFSISCINHSVNRMSVPTLLQAKSVIGFPWVKQSMSRSAAVCYPVLRRVELMVVCPCNPAVEPKRAGCPQTDQGWAREHDPRSGGRKPALIGVCEDISHFRLFVGVD